MKFITIQQKVVAFLLAFMLSGSIAQAEPRGPIDHGDSHTWISEHLECDIKLAAKIKELALNLDDTLYNFLDYHGNQKGFDCHIAQFTKQLAVLDALIKQHTQHAHHGKATKNLKIMHENLVKIRKAIENSKGKKGMLAAISLGTTLDPLLKAIEGCLPVKFNTEARLKKSYNTAAVDYLKHFQERLKCK